jgi:hypothetical protein
MRNVYLGRLLDQGSAISVRLWVEMVDVHAQRPGPFQFARSCRSRKHDIAVVVKLLALFDAILFHWSLEFAGSLHFST